MEYQSILKEKVTPSSVKKFIWEHSNKVENRSFRDNSKTSQYTHKYSTEKNVYQSMKQYDRNLGIVSVAELSSDTFIPQVMNQNKVSLSLKP